MKSYNLISVEQIRCAQLNVVTMVCGVSDALLQMLLVQEIEKEQASCFSDIDGNLIAGGRVGKQPLGVSSDITGKIICSEFQDLPYIFWIIYLLRNCKSG